MKDDPVSSALEKLPRILRKDLDKDLCVCNQVPKLDIIKAIINGATTVEEIKKETYATMGTACCQQQVERLIECITAPELQHKLNKTEE
ncbi:MAG: (2Fe-2S)-binding protein [Gammaproteobacteria bacterium]|nr:(2Fe-2S)-binding protein [Gammaproteobacteria bacterium]